MPAVPAADDNRTGALQFKIDDESNVVPDAEAAETIQQDNLDQEMDTMELDFKVPDDQSAPASDTPLIDDKEQNATEDVLEMFDAALQVDMPNPMDDDSTTDIQDAIVEAVSGTPTTTQQAQNQEGSIDGIEEEFLDDMPEFPDAVANETPSIDEKEPQLDQFSIQEQQSENQWNNSQFEEIVEEVVEQEIEAAESAADSTQAADPIEIDGDQVSADLSSTSQSVKIDEVLDTPKGNLEPLANAQPEPLPSPQNIDDEDLGLQEATDVPIVEELEEDASILEIEVIGIQVTETETGPGSGETGVEEVKREIPREEVPTEEVPTEIKEDASDQIEVADDQSVETTTDSADDEADGAAEFQQVTSNEEEIQESLEDAPIPQVQVDDNQAIEMDEDSANEEVVVAEVQRETLHEEELKEPLEDASIQSEVVEEEIVYEFDPDAMPEDIQSIIDGLQLSSGEEYEIIIEESEDEPVAEANEAGEIQGEDQVQSSEVGALITPQADEAAATPDQSDPQTQSENQTQSPAGNEDVRGDDEPEQDPPALPDVQSPSNTERNAPEDLDASIEYIDPDLINDIEPGEWVDGQPQIADWGEDYVDLGIVDISAEFNPTQNVLTNAVAVSNSLPSEDDIPQVLFKPIAVVLKEEQRATTLTPEQVTAICAAAQRTLDQMVTDLDAIRAQNEALHAQMDGDVATLQGRAEIDTNRDSEFGSNEKATGDSLAGNSVPSGAFDNQNEEPTGQEPLLEEINDVSGTVEGSQSPPVPEEPSPTDTLTCTTLTETSTTATTASVSVTSCTNPSVTSVSTVTSSSTSIATQSTPSEAPQTTVATTTTQGSAPPADDDMSSTFSLENWMIASQSQERTEVENSQEQQAEGEGEQEDVAQPEPVDATPQAPQADTARPPKPPRQPDFTPPDSPTAGQGSSSHSVDTSHDSYNGHGAWSLDQNDRRPDRHTNKPRPRPRPSKPDGKPDGRRPRPVPNQQDDSPNFDESPPDEQRPPRPDYRPRPGPRPRPDQQQQQQQPIYDEDIQSYHPDAYDHYPDQHGEINQGRPQHGDQYQPYPDHSDYQTDYHSPQHPDQYYDGQVQGGGYYPPHVPPDDVQSIQQDDYQDQSYIPNAPNYLDPQPDAQSIPDQTFGPVPLGDAQSIEKAWQ